MRSASRADSSVGSASASSRAFVCRLCVPPRTAASAWIVVRTTLLSTDWAVRRAARGLDVEAAHHRARVRGAEAVAHDARPHPARGAELGDLLEQLAPGARRRSDSRPRERVDVEPSRDGAAST